VSRTINELNTTDTIVDADKFVIWQNTSQATRAITAADMADYFSLAGGPYQPSDELLTSIAALGPSTTADRMIYTTAQDVAALTTLTAFGRSLIDDANQAAGQTTLGYTAADVLAKLITVDGAGSGLDADLLDGVQGTSYARRDTTNTFTAAQTVSASGQALTVSGATDPYILVSDTTGPVSLFIQAVDTQVNVGSTTNHPLGLYSNAVQRLTLAAAGDFSFTSDPPGPTNERTIGFRGEPRNRQDANYTLVLADAGKSVVAFGAGGHTWTIPANASVAYPIGTVITFWNAATLSVSIAITTDTMYLSPGGTTGTRTLAQWGTARLLKVDSTLWTISGTGLT
jgi:hypothetical protein